MEKSNINECSTKICIRAVLHTHHSSSGRVNRLLLFGVMLCVHIFYVNADMYSVKGEVLKTLVLTLISKSHH